MSRLLNRRQVSPVKISVRNGTEQRRTNPKADIERIINHAAKLMTEYNKNSMNQMVDGHLNNSEKVDLLLKASGGHFPKMLTKRNSTKSRKRRKKKHSPNQTYKSDISEEHRSCYIPYSPELYLNSPDIKTNNATVSQDEKSIKSEKIIRKSEPSSNISKGKHSNGSLSLSTKQSIKTTPCSVGELLDNRKIENIYEVGVKTKENNDEDNALEITVQLIGESSRMMKPILLNDYCLKLSNSSLFQTGSLDHFTIPLKESLGTINNVIVGIDSKSKNSSWFLNYISVKDCLSKKDYHFPCEKWLGNNTEDKLFEINLESIQLLKSIQSYGSVVQNEEIKMLKKNHNKASTSSKSSLSEVINHNMDKEKECNQNYPGVDKSVETYKNEIVAKRSCETFVQPHMLNTSSIHKGVETNDILQIRELCEFSDDLKDACGFSPLHLAALYYKDNESSKKIIDYLLINNISVDCKSVEGSTSLHYAIIKNNLPAVKYLVEKCGANPNILDKDGNTSLELATKYGFQQIIDLLKEKRDNNTNLTIQNVNLIDMSFLDTNKFNEEELIDIGSSTDSMEQDCENGERRNTEEYRNEIVDFYEALTEKTAINDNNIRDSHHNEPNNLNNFNEKQSSKESLTSLKESDNYSLNERQHTEKEYSKKSKELTQAQKKEKENSLQVTEKLQESDSVKHSDDIFKEKSIMEDEIISEKSENETLKEDNILQPSDRSSVPLKESEKCDFNEEDNIGEDNSKISQENSLVPHILVVEKKKKLKENSTDSNSIRDETVKEELLMENESNSGNSTDLENEHMKEIMLVNKYNYSESGSIKLLNDVEVEKDPIEHSKNIPNEFESSQKNDSFDREDRGETENSEKKNVIKEILATVGFTVEEKDHYFGNQEEDQLDAENMGIMFHKTLPLDNYPNLKDDTNKIDNVKIESDNGIAKVKPKIEEPDTSVATSTTVTSSISSRTETFSPITPRTDSDISITDQGQQNISQKTIPVTDKDLKRSENVPFRGIEKNANKDQQQETSDTQPLDHSQKNTNSAGLSA